MYSRSTSVEDGKTLGKTHLQNPTQKGNQFIMEDVLLSVILKGICKKVFIFRPTVLDSMSQNQNNISNLTTPSMLDVCRKY